VIPAFIGGCIVGVIGGSIVTFVAQRLYWRAVARRMALKFTEAQRIN
jgi:hypothetical protein